MLFHTWVFLVFFLFVGLGYALLRPTRLATPWLLVASYVFYAGWNPWYLALILYSTALDFLVVRVMERSPRRRFWLIVSLVNNLGVLAWFKYTFFFAENVAGVARWFGFDLDTSWARFVLPVGISFYTFQSMSYTIDYYRGRIPREPSFIRFATFVAFFPQLIAGPIERASTLLPQLAKRPPIRLRDLVEGGVLFEIGFFKKVVLAAPLARIVEPIYAAPQAHDASAILLATLAFAWQIYFDFSGYTDMARGVARMMGFGLMVNFRHPYLATDLADFWSRWHISLSEWFRDYVYIPLGGSRAGLPRTVRNLMVTFLISGFWHGPSWTFVLWGLWHGLGVVAGHALGERLGLGRLPAAVRTMGTFLFVLFGWLLFRAESTGDVVELIRGLTRWSPADLSLPWIVVGAIVIVWVYQAISESRWNRWCRSPWFAVPALTVMILVQWFAVGDAPSEFIYFQF